MREGDVVGPVQDDARVDVDVSEASRYVRSMSLTTMGPQREAAGIDFVGLDALTSWMIAEVEMDEMGEMDEEPELGVRHDGVDTDAIGRLGDSGQVRIVLTNENLTTPANSAWTSFVPDSTCHRCASQVSAHACAGLWHLRHLEYFADHVRLKSMLFDGVLEPVEMSRAVDVTPRRHAVPVSSRPVP